MRPSLSLEPLRTLIANQIPCDGQMPYHGLMLHRYSHPTRFVKAPAFGVTLGLVVQGAKDVRIHDRMFHVDPRQYIVITHPLQFEGAAIDARPDAPYLAVGLRFSAAAVARALLRFAEAGGQTGSEVASAFVVPTDARMIGAFERLLGAMEDPLERQVLAPLAIEEILFRLLCSDAGATLRLAAGRGADGERILEVMQYINASSGRALRVEDLARRARMSPSHFAHRFSEVARVSPMRYLREVRLERARELLAKPGVRCADVAADVGFESPAHFSRQFRRRFGIAPTEYIERQTQLSERMPLRVV